MLWRRSWELPFRYLSLVGPRKKDGRHQRVIRICTPSYTHLGVYSSARTRRLQVSGSRDCNLFGIVSYSITNSGTLGLLISVYLVCIDSCYTASSQRRKMASTPVGSDPVLIQILHVRCEPSYVILPCLSLIITFSTARVNRRKPIVDAELFPSLGQGDKFWMSTSACIDHDASQSYNN